MIEGYDEGGGGEAPIEVVEAGGEGVSHDVIVVDEATFFVAGTFGDSPAEGLAGTGEDLGLTGAVLGFDLRVGMEVGDASGVDHGEEAVAHFAFDGGGEFDGDDPPGKGLVEQRPKSFADAGGVDDDVAGGPVFRQGFEVGKDGEVVVPEPGMAVDDAVRGEVEEGDGGEVDGDDGEGGGIAGGVG